MLCRMQRISQGLFGKGGIANSGSFLPLSTTLYKNTQTPKSREECIKCSGDFFSGKKKEFWRVFRLSIGRCNLPCLITEEGEGRRN